MVDETKPSGIPVSAYVSWISDNQKKHGVAGGKFYTDDIKETKDKKGDALHRTAASARAAVKDGHHKNPHPNDPELAAAWNENYAKAKNTKKEEIEVVAENCEKCKCPKKDCKCVKEEVEEVAEMDKLPPFDAEKPAEAPRKMVVKKLKASGSSTERAMSLLKKFSTKEEIGSSEMKKKLIANKSNKDTAAMDKAMAKVKAGPSGYTK
jgi:hypothetical protein